MNSDMLSIKKRFYSVGEEGKVYLLHIVYAEAQYSFWKVVCMALEDCI